MNRNGVRDEFRDETVRIAVLRSESRFRPRCYGSKVMNMAEVQTFASSI